MSIRLPSPKTALLFLLATTGSVYGLMETLSSVSETDSFLSIPAIEDKSHSEALTLNSVPSPTKPKTTEITPSSPSTILDVIVGTTSNPQPPKHSATVTVGYEDTSTGQTVNPTISKTSSTGTSSISSTKVNDISTQLTIKPVVAPSPSPKKPTSKPSAAKSPQSVAPPPNRKPSSPSKGKPKTSSSSATGSSKPKSTPLTYNQLLNWYNTGKTIPTSVQSINPNGEDEYDEKEILEKFKRSKWNAIWIQFIDYMLLAPDNSRIWKEQAQNQKKELSDSIFTKFYDPSTGIWKVPLFGRFYDPDFYKSPPRRPSDPTIMEWNGPNLAKACKNFVEWTPWGSWAMLGGEEVWGATWKFCVKPSKSRRGLKPAGWWY